ncbi:MAG: winged helix-turn-helix domain-containing protein [Hyphomicrobiaceae bacterium]
MSLPRTHSPSQRATPIPPVVPLATARRLWLTAQRLDEPAPFGDGAAAVKAAVEHLGYVQIDTIHVIERCHHHILFTRIPAYRREDLHRAQATEKTVFEYWTHALSYVPTRDITHFVRAMRSGWRRFASWYGTVSDADIRRLVRRIALDGPLTLRDLDEDVRIEKTHLWASTKPSKRVLQLAFYKGLLTISERQGMLKTYELSRRHFGWERLPTAASETETDNYLLDRALRAQGLVSLDSICHLDASRKPQITRLIEARVRRKELVPVVLEGETAATHWVRPNMLETRIAVRSPRVHILSPFDPLVIQRKRLHRIFGYEHRFEAYVPKAKRVLGYFALPVMVGDEVVAALDLKADRAAGRLLIQQWTWVGRGTPATHKAAIEATLDRFERFQLAR